MLTTAQIRSQIYSTLKVHASQIYNAITHMKVRMRYPYALPSDIGTSLGQSIDDSITFPLLLKILSNLQEPRSLARFMNRDRAEKSFILATRCERFTTSTLYSFRFNEGWIEFELHFDEEDKLRRLFILHKEIVSCDRIEIPLSKEED